jgi:hypothetical protein
LARITPAAIASAELVMEQPGLLGNLRADHHGGVADVVGEVDAYAAVGRASSKVFVRMDVIAGQMQRHISPVERYMRKAIHLGPLLRGNDSLLSFKSTLKSVKAIALSFSSLPYPAGLPGLKTWSLHVYRRRDRILGDRVAKLY